MESKREPGLSDSFTTKAFVRALSYRDFLTSLSLALVLLAFYEVMDYYSNEDWIDHNLSSIKQISFLFLIPVNHVIYKIEHRRSNNFIGRNFHDYIFVVTLIILLKIQSLINGYGFFLQIDGNIIVILFAFIVGVMIFELLVAVLKKILKLVGWQII